MNYYSRYPAHYIGKTMHLTMEQDGAYTRLLDWYYYNARPIPIVQKYAISRANNASEKRATDAVLREFFRAENGAFNHGRADLEIAAIAPKIDAARANGKKGGRPPKNPLGSSEKPSGLIPETQSVISTKALQAPSSNKEKEQDQKTAPKGDLFPGIDPQIVADFKALRNKQRAPITQTALAGIQREADKAGLSLEAALRTCCENSWRGFKAVWLADAGTNNSRTGHARKLSAVEQVAAANAEWEERERRAAAT